VEGDPARHDYAFAQEGTHHFFEGQDGQGTLEQDIDVSQYAHNIDANKQQGIFSAYLRTFQQDPSDQAWITITCVASSDSNAKALHIFNSDTITTTDKWTHVTDTFTIPASTRLIKISLVANRRNGADNDGYFDNIGFYTQQTDTMLNTPILIIIGAVLIAGILFIINKKGRPGGGGLFL